MQIRLGEKSEEAPAVATVCPQLTHPPLVLFAGTADQVLPLVLNDENPAVAEAHDEVRIELAAWRLKPEGVPLTVAPWSRQVPQPAFDLSPAVENRRAVELLASRFQVANAARENVLAKDVCTFIVGAGGVVLCFESKLNVRGGANAITGLVEEALKSVGPCRLSQLSNAPAQRCAQAVSLARECPYVYLPFVKEPLHDAQGVGGELNLRDVCMNDLLI